MLKNTTVFAEPFLFFSNSLFNLFACFLLAGFPSALMPGRTFYQSLQAQIKEQKITNQSDFQKIFKKVGFLNFPA
ncbi:MAG: hypothetical protein JSS82_17020 [Bacteroidetes bacterium]|nr:hypothetical protein [Bacteroidota bacterium]